MKHRHHPGGHGRHHRSEPEHFDHDDHAEHRRHGHHGGYRRGEHHGGRHRGRMFDYGELRLLVLAMIAEGPRHGYELIKAIEDRLGGSYSPSPGVIYPTLSWLDDMGYAAIDAEESGRKRYRITAEGEAFLAANRAAADELMTRIGSAEAGGRPHVPAPVIRAMENLKVAMRLRFRRGGFDDTTAEKIAAALDAAAQIVEKS
jgi:DNA-binding PadR family transcriptional regulator